MPYYECVYIARSDIAASQVDTLTADLKKIIDDNGGEVTKTEYWGLKSLAYRIKKNRKGHYSLLNLDAPADALKEMERNMRLNEDIIRYMSVRVDELEEGPSIMMQGRSGRGRNRRGRDHQDGGGRPPADRRPADKPPAEKEAASAAPEPAPEANANAAADSGESADKPEDSTK